MVLAGRKKSKCLIRGVKKVMPHDEFIARIRKSLYFGNGTLSDDMEISSPLAEYASELFSEPHKGHSLNRLNKIAAANTHATPCSLIMALIYLDRLNVIDSNYVRRITPSELFIVSMMISTKFYSGHDEEFYFSDWAKEGNMTEERLKQLEIEFLCAINWNIYISNEQFFTKLESIEMIVAHREGIRRGWLTYTELLNFLPSFTMAKFLLNNIAVLAVSYAASVITIAGAFFFVSNIPGNGIIKENRYKFTTSSPSSSSPNHTILNNIDDRIDNNIQTDIQENTAFNIDVELQKLDDQYNQEAKNLILLKKNNENSGPLVNHKQNIFLPINWRLDVQPNWNGFKRGYENYDQNVKYNNHSSYIRNNYTKPIFWNLFGTAQNSISRISYLWFKLM